MNGDGKKPMSDYKNVLIEEVAQRLQLKKGKGVNYHCFNPSAHKNNDVHPSLSIYPDSNRFYCHGCGIKGNTVELVKRVRQIDFENAIKWMEENFTVIAKDAEQTYQIRRINEGIHNRFFCAHLSQLILKDPLPTDTENIKKYLGKSYSIETLNNAGVKISRGAGKYGMAFPLGRLVYNPNEKTEFIHFEGRTDFLTGIEVGLNNQYGLISEFNKTSKIEISGDLDIFILDADDNQKNIFKRINKSGSSRIKFIRLPKEYKDFSEFYNNGKCTQEDTIDLINSTSEQNLIYNDRPTVSDILPATNVDRPIKIITGTQLLKHDFPPCNWIIEDFLPEGLTILAGAPKVGKSFLVLNLSVAVVTGGIALSKFTANQQSVIYIPYEDTERRLQDRLRNMTSMNSIASNLQDLLILYDFPTMKESGIDDLNEFLDEHKEVKIVIIDPLERFIVRKTDNSYAQDYQTISHLNRIAFDRHISIFLVHHDTKYKYEDPFDSISGTRGISGPVDTQMVLRRENGLPILHVRGRDLDYNSYGLKFDPITFLWSIEGTAQEVTRGVTQKQVIQLLKESDSHLKPLEISKELDKHDSTIRSVVSGLYKQNIINRDNDGKYFIIKE
jgi:hypothetical protein